MDLCIGGVNTEVHQLTVWPCPYGPAGSARCRLNIRCWKWSARDGGLSRWWAIELGMGMAWGWG